MVTSNICDNFLRDTFDHRESDFPTMNLFAAIFVSKTLKTLVANLIKQRKSIIFQHGLISKQKLIIYFYQKRFFLQSFVQCYISRHKIVVWFQNQHLLKTSEIMLIYQSIDNRKLTGYLINPARSSSHAVEKNSDQKRNICLSGDAWSLSLLACTLG